MRSKRKYGGLDIFRVTAAFLVVAIHTSPLQSFNGEADFFLTRVLARIAVPFFLMVTGQFVLGDYLFTNMETGEAEYTQRISGILRYVKKLGLLYAGCILLYLPIGMYAGHYRGIGAMQVLKMLVFDGTFYHLWYFPASILGVLVICLLRRFLPLKAVAGISGVLYLLGLFGDSYYGALSGVPAVKAVYDACFNIFSYTRNGLFFVPVFLILGAAAGKKAPVLKPVFNLVLFLICFGLMTGEAFILHHLDFQRHDSMYFLLIPCMFFLYRFLLSWQFSPCGRLRMISSFVYILHPAVIVVVRGAAKALHLTALLVENSLVHYIAVSVTVLAAAVMASMLMPAIKKIGDGRGRTWIELDRKALEKNVKALSANLPDHCRLMPAVKADAYGHGAVLVAKELNRLGVNAFCVATAEEGAELRKNGVKGEILVLGYTHPEAFFLLHRYHLMQTVVDLEYAGLLDRAGKKQQVHIAVDTGMHRLGIPSDEKEQLRGIYLMKNLVVKGLFTHLCADDTNLPSDRKFTEMQAVRFYDAVNSLEAEGYPCPKVHLLASYGVLNYPEFGGDYARVGIALYGVLSTEEDTVKSRIPLEPVLSLKARVVTVKPLHRGESAGYGQCFTAEEEMTVAVLAIGYADGLPRSLSCGVGQVLINGCRAEIVGKICMDQTIVNVSRIPGVQAGDAAVIIGKSGKEEITAGELAMQSDSITNEVLSRLGKRLGRVIV